MYVYIYMCVYVFIYVCIRIYFYICCFLIYRHALPLATVSVGIGREKRSATTKMETNAKTPSPWKKKKRHGPKRMIGECVCKRERAREREVGGLVWLDENRSWHTYEWAMSRVWMRHVKRVKACQACHVWMSHVTYMYSEYLQQDRTSCTWSLCVCFRFGSSRSFLPPYTNRYRRQRQHVPTYIKKKHM